jgi:hypothetical protein
MSRSPRRIWRPLFKQLNNITRKGSEMSTQKFEAPESNLTLVSAVATEEERIANYRSNCTLLDEMFGEEISEGAYQWFLGQINAEYQFCACCTFPKSSNAACTVCGQVKEVLASITDCTGWDERIQSLAVSPEARQKHLCSARSRVVEAWYDEIMSTFMAAEAMLDVAAAEGVVAFTARVGVDLSDLAQKFALKYAA